MAGMAGLSQSQSNQGLGQGREWPVTHPLRCALAARLIPHGPTPTPAAAAATSTSTATVATVATVAAMLAAAHASTMDILILAQALVSVVASLQTQPQPAWTWTWTSTLASVPAAEQQPAGASADPTESLLAMGLASLRACLSALSLDGGHVRDLSQFLLLRRLIQDCPHEAMKAVLLDLAQSIVQRVAPRPGPGPALALPISASIAAASGAAVSGAVVSGEAWLRLSPELIERLCAFSDSGSRSANSDNPNFSASADQDVELAALGWLAQTQTTQAQRYHSQSQARPSLFWSPLFKSLLGSVLEPFAAPSSTMALNSPLSSSTLGALAAVPSEAILENQRRLADNHMSVRAALGLLQFVALRLRFLLNQQQTEATEEKAVLEAALSLLPACNCIQLAAESQTQSQTQTQSADYNRGKELKDESGKGAKLSLRGPGPGPGRGPEGALVEMAGVNAAYISEVLSALQR